MAEPIYEQICMKDSFRIQAHITPQSQLSLRVLVIHNYTSSLFQKNITNISQIDDNITDYYSSFEDLLEFMKDSEHLKIQYTEPNADGEEEKAVVVMRILEGKSLKSVLAKIVMPFVRKVTTQGSCGEAADSVTRFCESSGQLKPNQIKQLFKIIASGLKGAETLLLKLSRPQFEQKQPLFVRQQSLIQKIKDKLKMGSSSSILKLDQPQKLKLKHKQSQKDSKNDIKLKEEYAEKYADLVKKINLIEMENKKNGDQMQRNFKTALEDMKIRVNKLTELVEREVNDEIEEINKLIKCLPQKVGEELIVRLSGSKSEVDELKSDIQNLRMELKSRTNKSLKQKLMPIANSLDPHTWLQKQFNHASKISLEDNFIVANSPVNIFGSFDRSTSEQKKCFKVYIANMKQYIGIGLADENYRTLKQIGNNLVKFGSNGHVFDGNSEKLAKDGFDEGEEVLVQWNCFTSEVVWFVNGEKKYSTNVKKVSKSLLPFIVMLNKYDAVCLLKC